jgi:DNA-directed RNA polymerase sigma subunit (sigma70/sigma32)
MRELVGACLRVSDYLSTISLNPYTASKCDNVEHVQELLTRISKYRFDGNNYVYDVILDKKEQKRIATTLAQIATSGDESRRTQLENILTTLDPFRERILLLELGLTDGRPYSRREIMAIMELSASELSRERAIALTHLAGVEHLLLIGIA